MKFRNVPWKRNFSKLSVGVVDALKGIESSFVVVAQTKMIPCFDIINGVYEHLGLVSVDGQVRTGEPVLPSSDFGKWSARNREGWERKRRDLPKIVKTYTWETPNFGDASAYGTHTSSVDREVYQVEFDEPRLHKIRTEILQASEGAASHVLVKFSLDGLIDREDENFEKELLWAVNILQENTGVTGVYPSDASEDDYLATTALDWEVFPPGTADEIIRIFRKKRKGKPDRFDNLMEDRLRVFASLKPMEYLRGTAKLSSYVGAKFFDDLVVFENVQYGNALYVLYDDWRDISKRSRIDLLRGTSERFDRFVHSDGWEERFLEHIIAERAKRLGKRV